MALTLTYDSVLSRVRITGSGLTVTDTFTRSVSNGWGTSTSGHPWTVTGTVAQFSVNGIAGVHAVAAAGAEYQSRTTTASLPDTDYTYLVNIPVSPTGAYIRTEAFIRYVDVNNWYSARVHILPGNTIDLQLVKLTAAIETTLAAVNIGAIHIAGTSLFLRVQHIGGVLRAKVWRDGTTEPDWQVTANDSTHAGTDIAVKTFFHPSNTNTLPVNVLYDNLSAVPTVRVERSTNQVTWATVRGGAALVPTGGAISLDDYEFATDVANYYRVAGQTANITPVLDGVWLKSLARPFLNRKVTVVDYSDVERASRGGVFPIVGRSFPVAVTDLHGSRQWTLDVLADTAQEAEDLDLLISTGEVQFVHVPAAERVPGGYVALGNTTERRPGRRSIRRVFSMPFTEVAAPGPDVIPAIGTWQTVLNTYATWADVLAAHPTWQDLLNLVGSPADVVVP